MAKDEKTAAIEENKARKDASPSSVSATELAQAFIEALQQNTANRRGIRTVDGTDTKVVDAIFQYQSIKNDLEALLLPR